MLSTDNVVHLMRQVRVFFMQEAVLTPELCSLRDEFAESSLNVVAQFAIAGGPALSP